MKNVKVSSKKKRSINLDPERYSFEKPYHPNKLVNIILLLTVIFLPVVTSLVYLGTAYNLNSYFSFPLDDPWIHLTFAKNLVQYFSFSYYKNEMATAGSTSPLYTIIVALGFLVSKNEMILSYALGILFFSLASFSLYKLALFEFESESIFALLCTGVFIFDKWINLIAVSGMETTMFLFVLILCSYFYKKRQAVPFAVMLGLILWTRPDGIAFIFAVIADYCLILYYSKDHTALSTFHKNDLKKIGVIFISLTILYFIMNMLLSGSLLPNTYSAKLEYYTPEFRDRFAFIKYEIWEYFKSGYYFMLIYFGFIFSVLKFFYDVYKKNYNQNSVYLIFIFLFILIYFIKLPYAHRFGRYMMPIIPFFILVSIIGFRDLSRFIYYYSDNVLFSKAVFYILLVITFFMELKNYEENRMLYANQCRFIYERQVTAAKWIKENTKETDVIATHDIGAIGFYSDRKIVDVVGLVTPDLIKSINDPNYVDKVTKYMEEKGVTHLAFMKEWFRVANQNPLFTTLESVTPEVIEINRFYPKKTHIISREANTLLMNASGLFQQKAGKQIVLAMNRVIDMEPNFSYAYFLQSLGYYILADYVNYEKTLLKAIELFPQNREALEYLANFYKDTGRFEEAKNVYTKLLQIDPGNVKIINSLEEIDNKISTKGTKSDTEKEN